MPLAVLLERVRCCERVAGPSEETAGAPPPPPPPNARIVSLASVSASSGAHTRPTTRYCRAHSRQCCGTPHCALPATVIDAERERRADARERRVPAGLSRSVSTCDPSLPVKAEMMRISHQNL